VAAPSNDDLCDVAEKEIGGDGDEVACDEIVDLFRWLWTVSNAFESVRGAYKDHE